VNDLEAIGTVAKIVKQIKMPDGGITVIIQGKTRFSIDRITAEEPSFKATFTVLEDDEISSEPDFCCLCGQH
jgi:ATP-dependent Lon protease